MAYCTTCGSLLGAGAKTCRVCGTPVGQRPASDQPRNAPRRSLPIKADRLDKTVGLVVVVVVTAALTLYFVFAWVIPFIEGFIDGFFGAS
jgi:uncharacterized membrane protein YvbJ